MNLSNKVRVHHTVDVLPTPPAAERPDPIRRPTPRYGDTAQAGAAKGHTRDHSGSTFSDDTDDKPNVLRRAFTWLKSKLGRHKSPPA